MLYQCIHAIYRAHNVQSKFSILSFSIASLFLSWMSCFSLSFSSLLRCFPITFHYICVRMRKPVKDRGHIRIKEIFAFNYFRIEKIDWDVCIRVCIYFHCMCIYIYTYGWFLCDGRHWWGWMAAWRAGSSRLVLDQSVYVMLSTVFRRRYFEHVCCAQ